MGKLGENLGKTRKKVGKCWKNRANMLEQGEFFGLGHGSFQVFCVNFLDETQRNMGTGGENQFCWDPWGMRRGGRATTPRTRRSVATRVAEAEGRHIIGELVGGLVAMNFIFPEILGCDYHPN